MKTSSNHLFRRAGVSLLALAAVASALAFTFVLNDKTGLPSKWPAGSIPVKIMLGSTTTLSDGSTYNSSAAAAALAWNVAIGSAQIQTTVATGSAGDNNDLNEMVFADKVYGKDFEANVLAVTTGWSRGNERTEGDVIFNSAKVWDSYRGATRSAVDLQRVAIHELGHLLGLDHPDEKGQSVSAIMNSHISSIDALTQDDVSGAQSLYGPPGIPANDAFANAEVITLSATGTVTKNGVNTNATKETGEPSHAINGGPSQTANSGGRSVWWRWTAPSAGNVTLDTRGSYFDTLLAVYTGTALANLVSVASSDDIDPGVVQASTVTFTVTGGTTYRFAVDGFNNADGKGADSAGITLNLAFTSTGIAVPVITTQPVSVTVNTGVSTSFSVVATSTATLTYQWLFNGTAITGATNATYNLSSVTTAQGGTYSVTVTNSAGSVTSDGATLTVNTPAPTPAPVSSGGGGGGGGAPSLWFCAVLAALGLARFLRRNSP